MKKNHTEIRSILMDAAVNVVANMGLENATVRNISEYSNVNISYVYRYFIDKDDLIHRTYVKENAVFCEFLLDVFKKTDKTLSAREKISILGDSGYDYMIDNPAKCRFCRYYYNSPNVNVAKAELDSYFLKLVEASEELLPEIRDHEVFITVLMNEIYSVAINKINGKMSDEKIQRIKHFLMSLIV